MYRTYTTLVGQMYIYIHKIKKSALENIWLKWDFIDDTQKKLGLCIK